MEEMIRTSCSKARSQVVLIWGLNGGITLPYLRYPSVPETLMQALYQSFAINAGCYPSSDVFNCLVSADFATLQFASQQVTRQVPYSMWAFLPVTDGSFIQQQPSSQLLSGAINGKYVLAGHNANEGSEFVPQNISTFSELSSWAFLYFPFLNSTSWQQLQQTYPDPQNTNLYENQQQRANLMYSENAFVCPTYWLAQGYDLVGKSWHFQFSTPPAVHSTDYSYYFPSNGRPSPRSATFSWDFTSAFANFISNFDPTIPVNPSGGGATSEGTFYGVAWPPYGTGQGNYQINFNVTSSGFPNLTPIGDVDNFASGVQGRCDVWRGITSAVISSTASGTGSTAAKRGNMVNSLYLGIVLVILNSIMF
jgi:hypothetical protein